MGARLGVSVNGGPVQTGRVVCLNGDSVSLVSLDNTGLNDAKFQFSTGKYPLNWAVPAGWSTDGTNIWLDNGNVAATPAFVLSTLSVPWGKWRPLLEKNGDLSQIDNSVEIEIVAPSGLHDIVYYAQYEEDPQRSWVGDLAKNIRLIDQFMGTALATSGVLSIPAKSVVIGAGTNVQNVAGISDLTSTSASFQTAGIVVLAADQTVDLRIVDTARNTGATGGSKNDSYRLVRTALWNKNGGAAPTSLGDSGVISNYGSAGESTNSAQFVASGSTQVLAQRSGVAGHTQAVATENCAQLRG